MRTISLAQLRFVDLLDPGDVVAWPQGPGEPLALTERLVAQGAELKNPGLLFALTESDTLRPELREHFRLFALNGAGTSRRVTAVAELIPYQLSDLCPMIRGGQLPMDVVLIQVRPLPQGGYTLGVVSDFTRAMVERARVVVALLNPALPLMHGDSRVEAEDIDWLVDGDTRLIDMPDPQPTALEREVARRVAEFVPDRATVQLGIGTLPAAVAQALHQHRGLGVHSGVVSDVLVDLVERGVVTNAHKGVDAGRTVTGGLFGTQRLRDFAERSGLVEMRSVEYTHQVATAKTLSRFHTINSAIEMDLWGQANSEVAGGRYLGAIGGLLDFVRAGTASPGGHSIIAFSSATPDGKHSRIVASLGNRPVTVPRVEVDVVITEQGVAQLRGCSLQERARRLLSIAHPDHREALARGWRDAGHMNC